MSDQDVFTPPAVPAGTTAAPDLNTILAEIKTADGRAKYSNAADALKSIPHKEQHISKLEQELADVRAELAKRASVEEIVAKVAAKPQDGATPPAALNPAEIEAIIERKAFEVLSKSQQESAAKANLATVNQKLAAQFGGAEAASKAVQAKAQELGIPVQELARMAQMSPNAVLAYFPSTRSDVPAKPAGGLSVPSTSSAPAKQFSMLNGVKTADLVGEFRRHKPE